MNIHEVLIGGVGPEDGEVTDENIHELDLP